MKITIPQGTLLLKEIEYNDLENLRLLRNEYRQYFINQDLISSEQQRKWYEKYLKTNDIVFSVFFEEEWSGCVSLYNKQDDNSFVEFGRFMLKNKTHKGLGKYVANLACQYAFAQLNVQSIILEVFVDNLKAINVYKKVGFKESAIKSTYDKEIMIMKLSKDDIIRFE